MDRPQTPWKDFGVSGYYAHNTTSGHTMFRSGEWKYVYHNVMDEITLRSVSNTTAPYTSRGTFRQADDAAFLKKSQRQGR